MWDAVTIPESNLRLTGPASFWNRGGRVTPTFQVHFHLQPHEASEGSQAAACSEWIDAIRSDRLRQATVTGASSKWATRQRNMQDHKTSCNITNWMHNVDYFHHSSLAPLVIFPPSSPLDHDCPPWYGITLRIPGECAALGRRGVTNGDEASLNNLTAWPNIAKFVVLKICLACIVLSDYV